MTEYVQVFTILDYLVVLRNEQNWISVNFLTILLPKRKFTLGLWSYFFECVNQYFKMPDQSVKKYLLVEEFILISQYSLNNLDHIVRWTSMDIPVYLFALISFLPSPPCFERSKLIIGKLTFSLLSHHYE